MSEDSENRRRSRLRWITLGEAVAIAAVLISALGLYTSWQDRRSDAADKAQASASAKAAHIFSVHATTARGGATLALAPIAEEQSIQSQRIAFPAALGVAPVETTGDPRIDAAWLADGLKKARHEAGMKDATAGDARLPIAITTTYLDDGTVRTDRALYDLGYAIEGHFLIGSSVRLRGLSLIARGADPARIDALWAARSAQPTISPGSKK